jgi:hypothetical protein
MNFNDTSSTAVFNGHHCEQLVENTLKAAGYSFEKQVKYTKFVTNKQGRIDFVVYLDTSTVAIECKGQGSGYGTIFEKVETWPLAVHYAKQRGTTEFDYYVCVVVPSNSAESDWDKNVQLAIQSAKEAANYVSPDKSILVTTFSGFTETLKGIKNGHAKH